MNTQDNSRFPAAVYAETVLSVNFRDAQRHFLDALIEIHYAHTLMLARQGIIPDSNSDKAVSAGSTNSIARNSSSVPYDGHTEDLFFFVEEALERLCGKAVAGSMHTARSRNDIDITLYRMCLRAEILVDRSQPDRGARSSPGLRPPAHHHPDAGLYPHATGSAHHLRALPAGGHRTHGTRRAPPAGRLRHRESLSPRRLRDLHNRLSHRPRIHRGHCSASKACNSTPTAPSPPPTT